MDNPLSATPISRWRSGPTLPSTNSHDYVWFERKNKGTGEVQYLADSPMSAFVSQPFRYDLEQGLKALDKKEFTHYDMGKERFDAVMAKAFPGLKAIEGERRSIVKVKERSDGNLDVTVERKTDGADLRKIDPQLRMRIELRPRGPHLFARCGHGNPSATVAGRSRSCSRSQRAV